MFKIGDRVETNLNGWHFDPNQKIIRGVVCHINHDKKFIYIAQNEYNGQEPPDKAAIRFMKKHKLKHSWVVDYSSTRGYIKKLSDSPLRDWFTENILK